MGELEKKLGALLKFERERRNIELEDLAENLRISQASLEHIENGNVEGLPSKIYFGLFAKTYAEALGIDYAATCDAIQQDIFEEEEITQPKNGTKKEQAPSDDSGLAESLASSDKSARRLGPKTKLFLAIIVAVIVIVGGYFIIKQLLHDMSSNETNQPEIEQTSTPINKEEATLANYDWNVPQYKKPSELVLELKARGASWATVLADGDTVIFRQLTPGRTYRATAKYRLRLSIAVPRVVDITLNGKNIRPISPETGRISRVDINQINVDSFLNLPATAISPPVKKTIPKPAPTVSDINIPDTNNVADTNTVDMADSASVVNNEH